MYKFYGPSLLAKNQINNFFVSYHEQNISTNSKLVITQKEIQIQNSKLSIDYNDTFDLFYHELVSQNNHTSILTDNKSSYKKQHHLKNQKKVNIPRKYIDLRGFQLIGASIFIRRIYLISNQKRFLPINWYIGKENNIRKEKYSIFKILTDITKKFPLFEIKLINENNEHYLLEVKQKESHSLKS